MSTLLKPLLVRNELLDRGLRIFSFEEFSRIFRVKFYQSKYFIEEQTKNELFVRLKNGLYTLKTDLPCEEVVANKIYQPSYLSFEYALAYYGIIPEMPYQITSATTKITRHFEVLEKQFVYSKIKEKAYCGYQLAKVDDQAYLIAEPEKAVIDYLYFESLGKKPANERMDLQRLSKRKMVEYAKLFERKSLIKLIEEKNVVK
jgi:predicted transcriptional regulator of viral defense system